MIVNTTLRFLKETALKTVRHLKYLLFFRLGAPFVFLSLLFFFRSSCFFFVLFVILFLLLLCGRFFCSVVLEKERIVKMQSNQLVYLYPYVESIVLNGI